VLGREPNAKTVILNKVRDDCFMKVKILRCAQDDTQGVMCRNGMVVILREPATEESFSAGMEA